ncbi:antitermination protein [Corynebacterium phocae]|uniref:Transcription termination/antitermination protein NusG n=1 Tax=Corynebacterium phocae TaxID=161895 RepID=A0A1L7D1A8_9CORY|nr:transcription termination/antitermination protein NusG [Corynebacterium phocae]APT91880.1 antitermination protein [Corynebacterium phocae]KAA8727425.1 transcription termination/antitermination protein NusG [Corynebacterium phocae]
MSEDKTFEPSQDNSFESALQEAVQAQQAEAAEKSDEASAAAEEAASQAEVELSDSATEAVEATGESVEAVTEAVAGGAADEAAAASAAEGAPEEESEFAADYKKRLREFTRELKKQPGQWFIIQCYSGYENKVKTNLDMRAQTLEVEDSIFDVVVPVEQVLETKDGKKKLVKRKLLPGYVLVRMDLNDAAWSVVRDTPGVTSFVGSEGNATPVKHRDVAKFLLPQSAPATQGAAADKDADGNQVIAMPEEATKAKPVHDFQVGEAVTILAGPLASVSATISEINPETGKMQGLVSIFGRETPVELSPTEIERVN